MAELSTLARPYAKAAFELAKQNSQLTQWADTLGLLSALSEQENVAKLFNSPSETPEGKAQKLVDICADDLSDEGKNFVYTLAENRRLTLLPEINAQYQMLKAEQEKSIAVDVVSAQEMSAEQQASLTGALSERLQRTVTISVSIDPALLGGAVIRAGDTIIDGSVRGRLAKLAEAINS
jgi:F-type H+-transporting ATPase subunit delta